MNLGYILRRIRTIKGLSYDDVINVSKVSRGSINNIENGINNPTVKTLDKLCSAYGTTSETVLYIVDFMSNSEEITGHSDNKPQYEIGYENTLNKLIEQHVIHKCGIPKDSQEPVNSNFSNAQDAVQFILSQPTVGDYGNFDINKLSDNDKINFANDLLEMIKMISPKYNK